MSENDKCFLLNLETIKKVHLKKNSCEKKTPPKHTAVISDISPDVLLILFLALADAHPVEGCLGHNDFNAGLGLWMF